MRRVIRKLFRNKVFERKVVLISGAAAGIGRALAQHLADHHNAPSLALERFGGIGVLVNNAAIAQSSAFADTDLAVFQRVMAVNYFGALHCTQAALRRKRLLVHSPLNRVVRLLARLAPRLFERLRLWIGRIMAERSCPKDSH